MSEAVFAVSVGGSEQGRNPSKFIRWFEAENSRAGSVHGIQNVEFSQFLFPSTTSRLHTIKSSAYQARNYSTSSRVLSIPRARCSQKVCLATGKYRGISRSMLSIFYRVTDI